MVFNSVQMKDQTQAIYYNALSTFKNHWTTSDQIWHKALLEEVVLGLFKSIQGQIIKNFLKFDFEYALQDSFAKP